jgi:hypothetical protein
MRSVATLVVMRRELHPPENDGTLTQLLEEAFARFESGESPVDLADWLSAESGYRVSPEWLDGAFGSVGPVQAAWALRAEADPQLVPQAKPTRDELVETVERLMPNSATYDSDREAYWAELLDAHVPHPGAVALIYHPSDVDPATWDVAAILDHVLAYRPIEL